MGATSNYKVGIMNKCPFCKSSKVKLIAPVASGPDDVITFSIAYVRCQNCEAEGPIGDNSFEAIRKWNLGTMKVEVDKKGIKANV